MSALKLDTIISLPLVFNQDLLDDEEDFKPVGNHETNIDSSDDEDNTSSSSRGPMTTPAMTSSAKVAMPKYDAKRELKQNDFTSSYGFVVLLVLL